MEFDLFVELRHASWFEDKQITDELHSMAISYNKGLLITDVAGRRDVLHMRVSNDSLMVRFVGNGLHPTDYTRVDEWIDRIKKYVSLGLKNIYFFTHEPDNILAPQLAHYLYTRIIAEIKISTRGPKQITNTKQLNLF